ncbi:MAG: glycosyl hydrolase [Candidatus Eremiobacteraeota bacterium]|nr:glycosyl hydrolase [Candidatus Eremiobacteraeota bacterium]
MRNSRVLAFVALLFSIPLAAYAADDVTQKLASKLQWRSIGPFIGGRVVAIAGVPSDPNLFYFGGVQGGIWRSTDYGNRWTNISDGKLPGIADSIGALAVAASNPRVIYAGTGESDIRGDFDTGDGMYRSSDAGKTWHYAGLRDSHTTSSLAIHPNDPNVVYAASMGHVFKSNPERGVFKTTDGGKTWTKTLFVDDKTGAIDVVMDPHDPRVLYASMWQAQRLPWKLTSGGPGSGLYKTTDAGAHWTNIAKRPGFAKGLLGRMGIAVAASNPRILYAIVQAHDGGVFRSTNAGASWTRVNAEMKLRQRAFYYMSIFVDPTNAQVAFAPEVDGVFKTTNGGKTWKPLMGPGDHHSIWINPHNPKILLEGDDGGATVSTDGGKTWSSENNQPTGQYYHVALDRQFPFHVYGAAQDEGAFEGPSATSAGSIALGDWHGVASGESTFVAPLPGNPNVTFGSGYYSTMIRQDNGSGETQNVTPWATYLSGASAAETRYRFGWTHPIFFSPANPHELLVTAQNVFSSTDQGKTWKILSPDLTRNDKSTEGPSGGPIDLDQTNAETFPDIASLAVSPLDDNVIWAGSADGLVHVTKNHGATWSAITPPELPQWAQISSIEASHVSAGTAYLSASRYMWDDFHPYVFKTTDYGAHWTSMITGLPNDQYVHVVRQDPRKPNVLFAGTRATVYTSLDGGQRWQPLTLNLPGAQVRDIAIDAQQGEVVAATHGRAFWILDNLAQLEQLAGGEDRTTALPQLFAPATAWLSHSYGINGSTLDVGQNPPYGATVLFNVPASYVGKTLVTLSFEDARGALVRSFTLHLKDKHAKKIAPEIKVEMDAIHQRAIALDEQTAIEPGMNRFQWDMRYSPATEVPGFREPTSDDFRDSVDGPTIVPGSYTTTLQYGDSKDAKPFHVQLDPRLQATTADLDARLALEMRIHNVLDGLNREIVAALRARPRLAPSRRAQVDRELAGVVQFDIHSSEGDVLHETRLRDYLAFLSNQIELAYARPTAAQYASFSELQAKAAGAQARLRAAAGVSRNSGPP